MEKKSLPDKQSLQFNYQNQIQIDFDLDGEFEILGPMTPEQQSQMMKERVNELTQFYQTNKNYQISSWYEKLKPFTFQSFKTQLNSIDAYILYWLYYNEQDYEKMKKQQVQLYQFYLLLIKKVDAFLQTQCKKFNKNSQVQCFMKLSTRSPKDLGYKYSKDETQQISEMLSKRLTQKFSNYKQQMEDKLSRDFINQIYRFFLDLSKEKFKIKNAQNFVQIFSSSQRIIIDISDFSFIRDQIFNEFAKKNYSKAQEPFIELWAREWKSFQWFEEIRCFYKDFKLTAISQYDQRCYFSQLNQKDKLIQAQINSFFSLLKPALKQLELPEGVMDLVLFGVQKKTQKLQIKLIEINVFNRNSRASLFSWDKDLAILNGQIPLEIRLIKQPKQISKDQLLRLMGMIQKGTQQIILQAMKDLEIQKLWIKYQ